MLQLDNEVATSLAYVSDIVNTSCYRYRQF